MLRMVSNSKPKQKPNKSLNDHNSLLDCFYVFPSLLFQIVTEKDRQNLLETKVCHRVTHVLIGMRWLAFQRLLLRLRLRFCLSTAIQYCCGNYCFKMLSAYVIIIKMCWKDKFSFLFFYFVLISLLHRWLVYMYRNFIS